MYVKMTHMKKIVIVIVLFAAAAAVFLVLRGKATIEESEDQLAVQPHVFSKGIKGVARPSLSTLSVPSTSPPPALAPGSSAEVAGAATQPSVPDGNAEDALDGYRTTADQLAQEGKMQEVVQLYLDAIAKDPSNPDLRNELGFAYADNDQLDLARQAFDQRLAEDPNDPDARFGLGAIERLNGNTDEALAQFNEALRVDPDHIDAKFNMAETLTFNRGQQGTAAEKYLAEKYYGEILKTIPDDLDAQNGLAAVYLSTGRAGDAVGIWEKMSQESPDESVIMSNLGEAYMAANRPDDAYRSAQKALELDPENGDAYFFLGSAEIARGNTQAGIDAIRRAAELDPNNPEYQKKLQELSSQ